MSNILGGYEMIGLKREKEKLLSYDKHIYEIQRRIKKLRQKYIKHGLSISILSTSQNPLFQKRKISIVNRDSKEVGNFFFYPTHKIFEYDGIEKKYAGMRICCVMCIQKTKDTFMDTYFRKIYLNVNCEMLKDGKWLKKVAGDGFKLNKKFFDIEKLMKSIAPKKELIISSVIGWVKTITEFHYVPITNSKKNGIEASKDVRQAFQYQLLEDLNEYEAYKITRELLSATSKDVSIPLISFTLISSLDSLITKKSKEQFILCLSGNSERLIKMLSNLFCNVYNRSSHIYELDTKIHANQSLKNDISDKAKKLKDAVFISKVSNRSELKNYTKIIEEVQCGLLLINSNPILHDMVIDIDTNSASIDHKIVQYHQENPAVFTTWFHFFIRYIQSTLQGKQWERDLMKVYEDCLERLEKYNRRELNPTRLRQCAWLLTGYFLFVKFGYKIDAFSEEEHQKLFEEALPIFINMCALDANDEEIGPPLTKIEKDSLSFLHAIDNLLTKDGLNRYGDNSRLPEWGWYDEEKLYLENKKVFDKVNSYLISNGQSKLESKSSEIYNFLHQIGIILERDKNGWGIQHVGSKKTVRYSIQKMKEYLQDKECELANLSTL
jgi:hypothetical protein